MGRLGLTLVLIPGVLLTQFAAVPHAHEAGSRQGTKHSSQPHFHFHQFTPAASARGPVAPREHNAPVGPVAVASGGSPCETDHDADAVYVEAGTAATERAKYDGGDTHAHAAAIAHLFALDFLARVAARHAHPPAARAAQRCPLYVRYLVLTI